MTVLGKFVVTILYWALILLFVWLFYDEYITEHQFSSLCFCIAFFFFGCSLNHFLITWLYKAELDRIEKIPKILEYIISILTFTFLGIAIIAFLMGLIGSFVYLCIYGIIAIIYQTWELWVLIILSFVLSVVFKILKFPLIKALSKIIYRISLLSVVTLIIYIEIDVWSNLSETDSFMANNLIAGCVILLFLCVFTIYLLYSSMKKGILSFAQFKYVLFLRAFKDDDNIATLYNTISQSINNIPLMKIGDPSKNESKDIHEHWLPLSNWKFFLKFYIVRAKAIVIVASSTEGVIWEVMQNIKYLNKCIIYFASPFDLNELKKRLLGLNDNSLNVLIYSIEKVLKNREYENAFVVQNNKIYIGEVSILIESILQNNFENLKFVDTSYIDSNITIPQHKNTKVAIGDFIFRHFHIYNAINNFESIHNTLFLSFVKCIGILVVITFYSAATLMGIGLILYPLAIWFGHHIDWLGASYEDYSIFEKILMTWLSICFGVGILKQLYSK